MTKAAKKTNRQVEPRTVDSLIVYGRNARTHSDDQIGQIMASLREFGWTNPVLIDEKSNIIAGRVGPHLLQSGLATIGMQRLDAEKERRKPDNGLCGSPG